MGGVWNNLEKQARKSLKCYKQNLTGNSGKGSKDWEPGRNVHNESRDDEGTDRHEYSNGNDFRHPCYTMEKFLLAFSPFPDTLWEANLKVMN